MMNNQTKQLPAGLLDNNIELFANQNKLFATHHGSVKKFSDLPIEILQSIALELSQDEEATLALEEWKTKENMPWDDLQMLERFAMCKWGGFDNRPDVINVKCGDGEYWECGARGTCPFQGKICKQVKVDYGVLSWREIQTMKLIAQGLEDHEIAEILGVSPLTVPNYKKAISLKVDCSGKLEIAMVARNLNLI